MPDEATLARMYGPEYGTSFSATETGDEKEPQRVIAWLRRHEPSTFIDYGCGSGRLLADVGRLGWRTFGVEFDDAVSAATARRLGTAVVGRRSLPALAGNVQADVVHLGDVAEHLTDPDYDMRTILELLRPGGHLIAQGPLEANPNLFTTVLKWMRRLRGAPASAMAPYHVVLATAQGQQRFFERFGLRQIEFSMHEVAWPAPGRIDTSALLRPRAAALFTLRKASQAMSALRPRRWGNRYFYIGQRP